jgi:hypothetical protein
MEMMGRRLVLIEREPGWGSRRGNRNWSEQHTQGRQWHYRRHAVRAEEGCTGGGPACCHIAYFIFFKYSSNWFELIWSEGDPLVLEKFQIKYGRVDIELRSKFSYWIFSKFRTEFELKFTEPI